MDKSKNQQRSIRAYVYSPFDKRIMRKNNLREYAIIHGSALFDPNYYEQLVPEIKAAAIDPLLHYLQFGWKRGLKPSENFDPLFYTARYMKGAVSLCPLKHYYYCGRLRGSLPNSNPEPELLQTLAQELERDKIAFGEVAYPDKNFKAQQIMTGNHLKWIRYEKFIRTQNGK